MTAVHMSLYRSVGLYFVIMALWGVFLWLRGRSPGGSYLGAVIISEVLAVVQVITGLILLVTGHHPKMPLHYLYGVIVVAALPLVYGIADQGQTRRASLYFGLAYVFLAAIVFARTPTTGG